MQNADTVAQVLPTRQASTQHTTPLQEAATGAALLKMFNAGLFT